MSVDPSFSFDVYPGLDAELQAALERNVAAGTASPEAVATAGLGAAVSEAIAKNDPLANANLAPAFQQNMESARAITVHLFDSISILNRKVPELDSEEFKIFDWEKLQTAYATMQEVGLQPELVFTPLGLALDYWRDIYADLPGTKSGGLYLSPEVEKAWPDLSVINKSGWSVSVIPGTSEPTIKNVPHNMSKADLHDKLDGQVLDAVDLKTIRTASESFPDVSTYLMLQATRLQKGETPIDASTWTWLEGEFDNGTKAPCAYWGPDLGQVDVDWDVPGYQVGRLGVRPAVRG